MKLSIAITLLAALFLPGCKAPPPPVADDTIVASGVDDLKLTHRHAIRPPHSFTPINNYRALYDASGMTSPEFGSEIVHRHENGMPFTVLRTVEHHWPAVAEVDQPQLIGDVPVNDGVKNNLYEDALKSERPPG